jgi:protein-tyrosine phosphatase
MAWEGAELATMTGFVDMHAHLLPGIDDGPGDLDAAVKMAGAAVDAGIEVLAATPHLRSDFPAVRVQELSERCDRLRLAIVDARLALDVIVGAETSLAWALEADDQQLRLASFGQLGTDLLIETPSEPLVGFIQLLAGIGSRGFRVTLAHPERSHEFQRDLGSLQELTERGVLLQVNAESLVATDRRSPVRRLAERLCADGIAHALGSDGHRAASWRPVGRLAQGVAAASELTGPERASWMGQAAPAAIIAGMPLPDPPPLTRAGRGSRLFGRR